MEYEVERIIGKRVRNGQVEYKIEWTGYGPESNSWEKIDEIEFAESIQDFLCIDSKNIIAYQKIGDEVKYLVKGNNRNNLDILPSTKLRQHRPEIIIEFLQQHIRWEKSRNVVFDDFPMAQEVRPGPIRPEKVIYATDVSKKLVYFVEYHNKSLKYIEADKCKVKWPELIINYLENLLD